MNKNIIDRSKVRSSSFKKLPNNKLKRNEQSLKFFTSQLCSYRKKLTSRSNVEVEQNVHKRIGNITQSYQGLQSKEMSSVSSSRELDDHGNNCDKNLVLLDNLILNLHIFKKVFASSKKKKSIAQKLYGWDPIFKNILFSGEEVKNNLKRQDIIKELNLDKKCFATRNTVKKLTFFLSELTNANFRQQQSQCIAQRQRLFESSSKLQSNINSLNASCKSNSIQKYVEKMKETQLAMLNLKMKIKNRGSEIEKISNKTGAVKLNPFFFKQQKNIQKVQLLLKDSIKNDL